jgi:hypothetical protein
MPVDALDLTWWEEQTLPCPRCGGPGRLLVLEVTDQSTDAAVRQGLACLGDCCIDGLAPDRQCVRCGHRF